MKKIYLLVFVSFFMVNCSSDSSEGEPIAEQMYFPPSDGSNTWETKSIADLEWNQNAVQPLLDYLELKNTNHHGNRNCSRRRVNQY